MPALSRIGLLFCLAADIAFAQAPSAIMRRHERRVREARRAVAAALAAEARLPAAIPAQGTVAVIAGVVGGSDLRGLGAGLADLVSTDLARVHALRLVERSRSQALVSERALGGTDTFGRPVAWHWVGAADIVVLDAAQSGSSLRITARVVNLRRRRVDATASQAGALRELFAVERRLVLDVLKLLGVEPTAQERRSLIERPAVDVDAFLAYAAAMDALDGGDAPQADRLLRRALEMDAGVNSVFDASALVAAGLTSSLAAVVPVPGFSAAAGDDPTEEGLATEGNESEYGEAWFEGTGDRSLHLYELAVPLSLSMALGRGRVDFSTMWASNRADTPANDVFHAWGFTDLHVRYSRPLRATGASLTFGGAFPTRDAHGVDDDIRRMPIAPDLLPSAMYRRRNAPSLSGGLYFTRPAGDWTWGAAAGAEWNGHYDTQSPSLSTIAVAPGMRWRVRGDAVRTWGVGRVNVGVAWMGIAPATRGAATITGGHRALMRAAFAAPLGAVDVEVGGWMLRTSAVRSRDTRLRPPSTMTAAYIATWSHRRAWTFHANLEIKRREAGTADVADVIVPQVSAEHPIGRLMVAEVGADYVTGHFHEGPAAHDIPVRGWLLRLGLRIEP